MAVPPRVMCRGTFGLGSVCATAALSAMASSWDVKPAMGGSPRAVRSMSAMAKIWAGRESLSNAARSKVFGTGPSGSVRRALLIALRTPALHVAALFGPK
ncbi:MAG: hypothetical protein WAL04_09885 [Acidimicrobiales bacterium]